MLCSNIKIHFLEEAEAHVFIMCCFLCLGHFLFLGRFLMSWDHSLHGTSWMKIWVQLASPATSCLGTQSMSYHPVCLPVPLCAVWRQRATSNGVQALFSASSIVLAAQYRSTKYIFMKRMNETCSVKDSLEGGEKLGAKTKNIKSFKVLDWVMWNYQCVTTFYFSEDPFQMF